MNRQVTVYLEPVGMISYEIHIVVAEIGRERARALANELHGVVDRHLNREGGDDAVVGS